jgi:hypothetical protein
MTLPEYDAEKWMPVFGKGLSLRMHKGVAARLRGLWIMLTNNVERDYDSDKAIPF